MSFATHACSGRRARLQWNLNRGAEALELAREALAMLPAGEALRERASLLSWLARTRYLRGRFREAVVEGEEALEAGRSRRARSQMTESEVLNTLGNGADRGGRGGGGGPMPATRALALAKANDDLDDAAYAYSNLADMLFLAGRDRETRST